MSGRSQSREATLATVRLDAAVRRRTGHRPRPPDPSPFGNERLYRYSLNSYQGSPKPAPKNAHQETSQIGWEWMMTKKYDSFTANNNALDNARARVPKKRAPYRVTNRILPHRW